MDDSEFYSKIQFASLVMQGIGRSKSSHERGVADRLATSFAILAAVDGCPVATRVVVESGRAVVYLARNGGWTREIRGYIDEMRSLLLAVSRRSEGRPVDSNTHEVQALKALVEKQCGRRYHKKLAGLRRRMSQSNPMDLIEGLKEYQVFKSRVMSEDSLWLVSLACDAFYRKFKVANPDTESTTVYKISRMATLYFAFNTAVNCASKMKYAGMFAGSRFEYLESQQAQYTLRHWREILVECAPDAGGTQDLVQYYERSARFQRESEGVYSPERSNPPKATMHAEMVIASKIVSSSHGFREFIGTSKSCCILCYHFIQRLQHLGGNVYVRSTHGKLYPGWMIPRLGVDSWDAKMRKYMEKYVKEWMREGLCKERLLFMPPDSDSHSGNSSDVNCTVPDEDLDPVLKELMASASLVDSTDPV